MKPDGTALRVRRVGIDTYRENVAHLHRRCPLERARHGNADSIGDTGSVRRDFSGF